MLSLEIINRNNLFCRHQYYYQGKKCHVHFNDFKLIAKNMHFLNYLCNIKIFLKKLLIFSSNEKHHTTNLLSHFLVIIVTSTPIYKSLLYADLFCAYNYDEINNIIDNSIDPSSAYDIYLIL